MKNLLIEKSKHAAAAAGIFLMLAVAACDQDQITPEEPEPEPGTPPVQIDTTVFQIASIADLKNKLPAILLTTTAERTFADINISENIAVTADDLVMLERFPELAKLRNVRISWNDRFIYPAKEGILLTPEQCEVLKTLPFGKGPAGPAFKIQRADRAKFTSKQLENLTFDAAQLFEIANSSEFGSQIRAAAANAALTGEDTELKFTGDVRVPADSLARLRDLWPAKVQVVPGSGSLTAVLNKPTPACVLNSAHGLTAAPINLEVLQNSRLPGGLNPIGANDTTFRILRTHATQKRAAGEYAANCVNAQGGLINPVFGKFVFNEDNGFASLENIVSPSDVVIEIKDTIPVGGRAGIYEMLRESYLRMRNFTGTAERQINPEFRYQLSPIIAGDEIHVRIEGASSYREHSDAAGGNALNLDLLDIVRFNEVPGFIEVFGRYFLSKHTVRIINAETVNLVYDSPGLPGWMFNVNGKTVQETSNNTKKAMASNKYPVAFGDATIAGRFFEPKAGVFRFSEFQTSR
jgi:hypothetical protein